MKIQKLNQAQTELLSNIVQKRIEKFLFSQQINITHFEGGINWLYSEILKRDNPEIIYCNSWFDALSKIDKLNPNSAIEKKEYFSILISNCVAVEKNKR